MKLITEKISLAELKEMSKNMYGGLVKAVVDKEKEIMVVDAEMHADEEVFLLEQGSEQKNLWGINIYPDQLAETRIEFDSMINIRPIQKNRTRDIEDPKIRKKITAIVNKLIE